NVEWYGRLALAAGHSACDGQDCTQCQPGAARFAGLSGTGLVSSGLAQALRYYADAGLDSGGVYGCGGCPGFVSSPDASFADIGCGDAGGRGGGLSGFA